jgi:hypothetical protein
MVLPVFMAFYLYLKGEVPSANSPFIDEYVEKTVILAKSRAGTVTIMFLLASLMVDNYNPPWSYENAVDITFGIYMMTMGLITWWEMREEPEPESEFESELKADPKLEPTSKSAE